MSIKAYNNPNRAEDYHVRTGFDPKRKSNMLNVTLDCLIDLTKEGSKLLELGAGSGLFTKQLIETEHFSEIHVTDGAENMLAIAEENLQSEETILTYSQLNFSEASWSKKFANHQINAVTSSMALHHATDKQTLFNEVYNTLEDGGVFVFADHMAGATPQIDRLIGAKRARIKGENHFKIDDPRISEFIEEDNRKQAAEGNACESVSDYLIYLNKAGFTDVDCIWRDYWLAVFVSIKK